MASFLERVRAAAMARHRLCQSLRTTYGILRPREPMAGSCPAGTQLLTDIAARHATITKAWADNGYETKAVEHAAL